jgi:hypothetical protein
MKKKEIAPLVKWSLRLPYTFLSVGSPFIEEEEAEEQKQTKTICLPSFEGET